MEFARRSAKVMFFLIFIGILGYVYFYPQHAANSVDAILNWGGNVSEKIFHALARFIKALAN